MRPQSSIAVALCPVGRLHALNCSSRCSEYTIVSDKFDIQVLLEPFTYYGKLPGKGIRPRMIAVHPTTKQPKHIGAHRLEFFKLSGTSSWHRNAATPFMDSLQLHCRCLTGWPARQAFNDWLKLSPESLKVITDITQKLHNASLMIDDIEDNSKLRRGTPVAHVVYGVPQTLNTANLVYFMALSEVHALGNPRAVQVFLDEMLNLHRGQGLDIFWRDNNVCPTEEEYIHMVKNKTGGLFRLSVLLMQVLFCPLFSLV